MSQFYFDPSREDDTYSLPEGETIAEARGEEVCSECGERIPNDDAVIHYHPGAVIEEAI